MKVFLNSLMGIGLVVGLSTSFSAVAAEVHKEVPASVNSISSMSSALNLNTADAQAIANAHIKGIGKKRAEAIIAYRQSHGAFKSIDDLKQIKGLSDKVIDDNRSRFSVN